MLINIDDCKGLDMKLCQLAEEKQLTDEQFRYFTKGWQALWEMIIELPSADRPQGEWKSVKASIYPYGYDVKCSVCNFRMGSSFGYRYCPSCGARMFAKDINVPNKEGADDETD